MNILDLENLDNVYWICEHTDNNEAYLKAEIKEGSEQYKDLIDTLEEISRDANVCIDCEKKAKALLSGEDDTLNVTKDDAELYAIE